MGKWFGEKHVGDESTGNPRADAEREKFYRKAESEGSDASARQDALEAGREAAVYGRQDDLAYWREARKRL
jgi:hypothetical protein